MLLLLVNLLPFFLLPRSLTRFCFLERRPDMEQTGSVRVRAATTPTSTAAKQQQ